MVLDYLESSAMIANVLSLVSLGIIGVIIRNIVKAFGELRVEQSKLELAQSEYEQRAILAQMILVNGRLYKNAILASSLPSDGKLVAVNDYAELERLYGSFKQLELNITVETTNTTDGGDNIFTSIVEDVVEKGTELVRDAGADMIDNLRDQIKNA